MLDVVNAIALWIDAALDRRLDARKVVRMHAGPPHIVIDRRTRREAPHCPHRVVPLRLFGLWIPRVATQFQEIGGRLQPCLAFAQPLFGAFLVIDILQGRNCAHDLAGLVARMVPIISTPAPARRLGKIAGKCRRAGGRSGRPPLNGGMPFVANATATCPGDGHRGDRDLMMRHTAKPAIPTSPRPRAQRTLTRREAFIAGCDPEESASRRQPPRKARKTERAA